MSLSLAALFAPHSTFPSHVYHVVLFITCIIAFHHSDMAHSRVVSLFVVFFFLTSPPVLLRVYAVVPIQPLSLALGTNLLRPLCRQNEWA